MLFRSQALAVTESRDGAGLNNLEAEKWVVMPSDIGALHKCTGYLKLDGALPAAWVDYRSWNHGGLLSYPRRRQWAPVRGLPAKNPAFKLERTGTNKALDDIRADIAQERLQGALADSAQSAAPVTSGASAATAAMAGQVGANAEADAVGVNGSAPSATSPSSGVQCPADDSPSATPMSVPSPPLADALTPVTGLTSSAQVVAPSVDAEVQVQAAVVSVSAVDPAGDAAVAPAPSQDIALGSDNPYLRGL